MILPGFSNSFSAACEAPRLYLELFVATPDTPLIDAWAFPGSFRVLPSLRWANGLCQNFFRWLNSALADNLPLPHSNTRHECKVGD